MGNGLKTNIADSMFKMNLINNGLTPLNEMMTTNDALTQSKIDGVAGSIGSTEDSSASSTSGTIMGKLNHLITNILNLITYTKTDNTASSTGTISQKLSYLQNQVNTLSAAVANKPVGGFTVQSGFIEHMPDITGDYVDITIQSVDTTKSFVLVSSSTGMDASNGFTPFAILINSTTLRIYTTGSGAYSSWIRDVYWQVVTSR